MKEFTYIFFIVLFFSCAHENRERYHNYKVNAETVSKVNVNKKYKYESIVKQKLEDYIELLKLKEQKPELKGDIDAQLKKGSITALDLRTDAIIENIHQVGNVEIVSENVHKIKLKFTLIYDAKKVEDFIFAYIKYSIIILDGREIRSNKVSFSKL